MTVRWTIVVFASALAACGGGPKSEIPSVKQARSLAAEWAEVNSLAAEGKLNALYARQMRSSARRELGSAAQSFSDPASRQAAEVSALLALAPDAPAATIRAHVEVLEQIEQSLEAA